MTPLKTLFHRGAALVLTSAVLASAQSAEPPQQVLTQCQACHGINGVATFPGAPNLAGQPADYLTRQLQHYRSGERQNEQMSVVSKNLSDADIEAIAQWYAQIVVTVQDPVTQ